MGLSTSSDAHGLLSSIRRELASLEDAIRNHRYLEALDQGRVSRAELGVFANEQRLIIESDRRSFLSLATRFAQPPAGKFFEWMAEGEHEALGRLERFAAQVGGYDDSYLPRAGCHAYAAYVASLALNGSRADVVMAFLANLAAWGGNCARVARALAGRYDVSFFEFFASPPDEFESRALAVADEGLASGESGDAARRAAHLLQRFELLYWDTLADALH
jgi:thiaminase